MIDLGWVRRIGRKWTWSVCELVELPSHSIVGGPQTYREIDDECFSKGVHGSDSRIGNTTGV